MRPLGRLLLTSHRPPPSERQSGMPTGQPYCTNAKSRPILWRSSTGNPLNQSLTGSPPRAVR